MLPKWGRQEDTMKRSRFTEEQILAIMREVEGRRLRSLTLVDEYSRECPALESDRF
jgi:hypothetical protein